MLELIESLPLVAALLMGLGGSAHCISMCGGAHSLLASGLGTPTRATTDVIASDHTSAALSVNLPTARGLTLVTLFSLGRISSYVVAGLTVSALSYSLQVLNPSMIVWARWFSGLLLLLIAAQMLGAKNLLGIEAVGNQLWRLLSPLTKDLFPITKSSTAYIAGAVWGWVPCGMVYSALAWSALQASPALGATAMLMFGIGTLPSMLFAGVSMQALSGVISSHYSRLFAAALILLFAIWTIGNTSHTLFFADQKTGAHDHHHHLHHH